MADQQRTIIELEITLKGVVTDLKEMRDQQAMVQDHERTCRELREQVQDLHHALYTDRSADGPIVQQLAFLREHWTHFSQWISDARAAKGRGSKERVAIYLALIGAIGSAVAHFIDKH